MAAEEKIIYGYVEKVVLVDKNLVLSAKLDTGAKSASLSAVNIQEIEKDGKSFLQFTVPGREGDVSFTAECLGKVRIKVRAGENTRGRAKSEPLKRPLVMMRIRIGKLEREVMVNLTNRKRFNYPLLLGRDAIKAFSGLVDPGTAFTIKADSVKAVRHEL